MLFTALWLTGMVGVFSMFWINPPFLKEWYPLILKGALIQQTLSLSIAVLIGVNLAHQVGLSAPLAEAIASGSSQKILVLKPQIVPGLIGGVIGGIVTSSWFFLGRLWESSLPVDSLGVEMEKFAVKAAKEFIPIPTRILYGGITEEIKIRWGLMTLLVWVAWRLLQKAQGTPHVTYVILAIIISSLVTSLLTLELDFWLVDLPVDIDQPIALILLYNTTGKSLFGLIAGYLYWQKGLEAAIIAHMLAHVVVVTIDFLKGCWLHTSAQQVDEADG